MRILKIESLPNSEEWVDRDYIMLHACFQLLLDYIEKEKPTEKYDWPLTEKEKKAWKEIQALEKWWREYTKQDRSYTYLDTQKALVRLIKIRENLWT